MGQEELLQEKDQASEVFETRVGNITAQAFTKATKAIIAHTSAITPEHINARFTYHAPKDDQLERYERIREQARMFAHTIVQHTPTSREQSLAITHLEEAVMFANAAIARNE